MSNVLQEQTVTCPHCWEDNLLVLDPSNTDQVLIEDCQVCCSPMSIRFHLEDGQVVGLESEA